MSWRSLIGSSRAGGWSLLIQQCLPTGSLRSTQARGLRAEAIGNLCLGSKALVQERVGNFLEGVTGRKEEVKRRCRTILQSRAEELQRNPHPDPQHQPYAHPTLALQPVAEVFS